MTLTELVRRDARKHRVHDALREARAKNVTLDRALDNATCRLIALTTEIDRLTRERNQLEDDFDQAAVDLSGALEDLHEARGEIAELRRRLAPFLAAEANANAVNVPPMVRDTTAIEDQATGPINVRPLWEALGVGPTSPVTDPGHTH